jgi:hypothetical protein
LIKIGDILIVRLLLMIVFILMLWWVGGLYTINHKLSNCLLAEMCKKPLDDYVKEHFDNVKVVRAKKREGLIRTRLMGAKAATGDVLIFLDSHVEANINYLPPLLGTVSVPTLSFFSMCYVSFSTCVMCFHIVSGHSCFSHHQNLKFD